MVRANAIIYLFVRVMKVDVIRFIVLLNYEMGIYFLIYNEDEI